MLHNRLMVRSIGIIWRTITLQHRHDERIFPLHDCPMCCCSSFKVTAGATMCSTTNKQISEFRGVVKIVVSNFRL